ncbi:MAG: anion permease [Spirochaetales bacterium]|nr:anion permease [Spirochaetales bacterium]
MADYQSVVSIVVFIVAYVLFIVLPKYRTFVALGGAAALLASLTLSPLAAFLAVNWNVMGIFIGTLFVADVFIESRVPAFLAEKIVDRAPSVKWAMLFICALVSFISAFVENVAAVLIVAPIAFALAEKLKINPVKLIIGIAICSNLQGTATLIGDPPSMLLGGYAKMTFMDFFVFHGRPSIFFAVEIGALASFIVLYFFFRRHRQKVKTVPVEKVRSWIPTFLLVGLVVALAVSSFFDTGFSYAAGIISMAAGIFSLVWKLIRREGKFFATLKSLDWDTAGFLAGIFILVGGLTETGWVDKIAAALAQLVGGNVFAGFVLIVACSVLISAFVDNVPYLAAMLPVATVMARDMGVADASVLLFGLLIGASLGGNITPIGASANVVATGMLKKRGYVVRFPEFVGMGLPFTLAAVTAGAAFVWLVWG